MELPKQIQKLLDISCRSDVNVLIEGPTGSGKSHLARWIHDHGARRTKPFVVINLATVHEGTLESELFGHERGSYTGADQRRIGRIELAQGGTLFLDEIAELPLRLQSRLLEFLQSRIITPVGSNREIKTDIRVLAATNKNLETAVKEGHFREDLFHRLRVISITLPSLNERGDQFNELVHGFLEDACKKMGRSLLRISPEVAGRLESYSWPGNIRELRNVLDFAVAASDGPEMLLTDLPSWFSGEKQLSLASAGENAAVLGTIEIAAGLDYQSALSDFDREYLKRALRRCRGRINKTARSIGISKGTLIRRLDAYRLREIIPPLRAAARLEGVE